MISKPSKLSGVGNKVPNWESALDAYIGSCREKSFAWGSFDCVRFADGAFQAQYGINLFPPFDYDDLKSAQKGLKKFCKTLDLAEAVDQFLDRKDKRLLSRGDLVFHNSALSVNVDGVGGSIGICLGTKIALVGETSLQFDSIEKAEFGWRV